MKKFLALIALFVLVACGSTLDENVTVNIQPGVGEGGTTFFLEVASGDGVVDSWRVSTDEVMLGAALSVLGKISGDETAFGLMVTEVAGITADFAADGAWWAFYVGGEMSPVGVDQTYIEAGQTYAFVLRQ